ncbi:conserved hypothetical protein [Xanthomonas citri pv. citri]|uniref:Uncharacterized protein n=1 Tax=Xanthomonas citri pv. citri TaxID=611301 RepID=A0A0U5BWY7_XANCI|nr:conserved hypothetical protein [Xanthomonas citri pv. citri]CEE37371.1 conserved hypothetical protein [Xanthomonas citri pv. citri]CEE45971.1 conserved hypothetical protein [Xanthomonas citri pv. citri]CEE47008.1 conserved hypothetical protein [Xanthomonas citri pv. citri]CEE47672.1 conserved hypothetical protein [Xanthomonas citri pv. citri]
MRSALWRVETRRALRPRLAAWARRATQYRCATGRFRRVGRQRRGAGAAPLAANASHLNVHNTL